MVEAEGFEPADLTPSRIGFLTRILPQDCLFLKELDHSRERRFTLWEK